MMIGLVRTLRVMPMAALVITGSATAQVVAVDNGPLIVIEHGNANAALLPPLDPAPINPSWVPPREVMRMLRQTGYDVLSRPRLRGAIFSVVVVTPQGEDGRIFVDARDGRLLRFVLGYALTGRTEEEVGIAYNPPTGGPLRKPQPLQPKTASRAPTTAGIAPSASQPAAPSAASRPATATTSVPTPQTQANARPVDARPADAKPADAKPALVIQPTRELPPVLGLE